MHVITYIIQIQWTPTGIRRLIGLSLVNFSAPLNENTVTNLNSHEVIGLTQYYYKVNSLNVLHLNGNLLRSSQIPGVLSLINVCVLFPIQGLPGKEGSTGPRGPSGPMVCVICVSVCACFHMFFEYEQARSHF